MFKSHFGFLIPWLSILATNVDAGGGPENVLIVVNKNDPESKTVANHYCALRQIPACNVLELDYTGSEERTSIGTMRKNILEPIFEELKRRRLSEQIDYIVYSTGFPYAVNFTADFPGIKLGRHVGQLGSLTGLTYLHQLVFNKDPSYVQFQPASNYYASYSSQPSSSFAFRSRYRWTKPSNPASDRSYHLSMMLGYTAGRGNSVDEVLHYLRRSAQADGSHPKGTIYLVKNKNIRSTEREKGGAFEHVVDQLTRIGVDAKIVDGVLPKNKPDVMGGLIGYAHFDWISSGSTIQPGAIVEHLTSFGGVLKSGGSQTPLSEFLRYGAAGASGTVMEPLALQAKFPHPTIHCHYAQGCSLAEAFYQSVASPYQLLMVGDPLCKPWARIPTVEVSEIRPGQTIQGKISLTPKTDTFSRVSKYQLFIDGRLTNSCKPGEQLGFDSVKLADGYHELRVVAIEDSNIENQGRTIIPCLVNNNDHQITCQPAKLQLRARGKFRLSVNAPGATQVVVYHRRESIAKITQENGLMTIDTSGLGTGPVELTVVAKNGRGMRNAWFAKPVILDISAANERPRPPITIRETRPIQQK